MNKPRRSEKIRRERLEHQWGKPFSAIYRELRVVRGLDPDETARVCGVSRTTVWRWLREAERDNEKAEAALTASA